MEGSRAIAVEIIIRGKVIILAGAHYRSNLVPNLLREGFDA